MVVSIVLITSVVMGGLLQAVLTAAGWPDLAFLAVFAGGMAAANWVVDKRLNSAPPQELLDPRSNERVLLYRRRKLFWSLMQ
ncbi:hypothetical protein [Roseomonas haemaphysalidis]|uniref:hypothetical protein n=1 Tax=Roseomonas haemaphysalidis TaxID=2768162 RepID=UPI001A968488|nr:hypothetical protein [Roseomonas haemaphysalidis]